MAKGQMRVPKEKKKPKATDKPKHMSSYKASMQGSGTPSTQKAADDGGGQAAPKTIPIMSGVM